MLYTTRLHDLKNENIDQLKFELILADLSERNSIYIVSAYYSIEKIQETLERIGRGKDITIIVSSLGLSESKIAKQIEELNEIKTTNRQKIYLCTLFPLMHSKIYYGTNNNVAGAVCYVGSANLSNSGFNSNEEILVNISDKETKGAIRDYIYKLENEDRTILINDKANYKSAYTNTENLASYISRGFIIFKPTTSFSVTYTDNYLKEHARAISDQSQFRHSITESSTGIDIAKIAGISSLLDTIDNKNDVVNDESKSQNISIRPNCIETCLGYWLPEERYDQINEKLEYTKRKREVAFKEIIKKLTDLTANDATLVQAINEFVEDFEDFIITNSEFGNTKERFKNELHENVIHHIKTKVEYLRRNKDRYIRGLYITPMPYIWDDIITAESFTSSFFEDVIERNKSKSKISGVVHDVLSLFDLEKNREKDAHSIIMNKVV